MKMFYTEQNTMLYCVTDLFQTDISFQVRWKIWEESEAMPPSGGQGKAISIIKIIAWVWRCPRNIKPIGGYYVQIKKELHRLQAIKGQKLTKDNTEEILT